MCCGEREKSAGRPTKFSKASVEIRVGVEVGHRCQLSVSSCGGDFWTRVDRVGRDILRGEGDRSRHCSVQLISRHYRHHHHHRRRRRKTGASNSKERGKIEEEEREREREREREKKVACVVRRLVHTYIDIEEGGRGSDGSARTR